jgi:aspartyl-tRNA(Asn)/glutamyl-tRNA(Gln) amidotransferase subunit A
MDSIGPLSASVAACAQADAVLAGERPWTPEPMPLAGLRLGIPQGFPLRDLDTAVAARFAEATDMLNRSGACLTDETFQLFDEMARVNSGGSIVATEAYAIHRDRLAGSGDAYDPFVRLRIEAGRSVSAAGLAAKLADRAALVRAMDARLAGLDALVLPTTPIVAPPIADVTTLAGWDARNGQLLRNTAFANFFDLCAISLPLPVGSGLPVGLMMVARNGQDRHLFQMAAAVERMLSV